MKLHKSEEIMAEYLTEFLKAVLGDSLYAVSDVAQSEVHVLYL